MDFSALGPLNFLDNHEGKTFFSGASVNLKCYFLIAWWNLCELLSIIKETIDVMEDFYKRIFLFQQNVNTCVEGKTRYALQSS